jgi:hypothetical protein
LYNEVIVDLDNDWAEYRINENSVHGWAWSTGSFGQGNLNQLGGANFYAWTGAKGTPKYFIDDFMIEELLPCLDPPENFSLVNMVNTYLLTWEPPSCGEVIGYNLYYAFNSGAFELLETTTETSYTITSPGLGLHQYFLTAIFLDDESTSTDVLEFLITTTQENIDEKELIVFPNPATSIVSIRASDKIYYLTLLDITGKEILKKQVNNENYSMDVNETEAGLYFIKLETGEGMVIKRIIIE